MDNKSGEMQNLNRISLKKIKNNVAEMKITFDRLTSKLDTVREKKQ